MRRRLFPAALLAAALAACIPGGDGGGGSRQPAAADTVVVGVLSDIQNWNPYLTETAHSEDLLRLVYPSLAVEQVDYWEHPPSYAPALASAWEFSDDRLSLTLHLDERAVWSDGQAVTAEDVLFTYRTQISPELGWPDSVIKSCISAVEAVDPKTVRFHFTHVYPYQMMDVNDGLIIPAHAWSKIPYASWRDTDWSSLALSAGPFLLLSQTPQQEVVLERNPAYWVEGRPRLHRAVWRIVPNQGNLLTQLLSGEIDFMKGIPPREVKRIEATPHLRVVSFPDRGYSQVIWNTGRALFADPRVRRALTMSIDRQAIIDSVYQGYARPAAGPILSGMWAFNRALEPLPYDVGEARRLLAEAGWSDSDGDGTLDRNGVDFDFELLTNSENETRQDICILIQQQLERVGVRARPRFVEWGAMLSDLHEGSFDGAVHRWLEPTQVDLEEVWHSAPPDEPTLNYGRYANAEVDRLIEAANSAPDFAQQKPLFDRIQEIIVAEQPYTFLIESVRLDGLNTRVHGAVINDATPYFNLDEWWIDAGGGEGGS